MSGMKRNQHAPGRQIDRTEVDQVSGGGYTEPDGNNWPTRSNEPVEPMLPSDPIPPNER